MLRGGAYKPRTSPYSFQGLGGEGLRLLREAKDGRVLSRANLARVDDILAELRPQARRLAAQAEQQTTRSSIGDELATALLAATHARWHEAATRLAEAGARRDRAQAAGRATSRRTGPCRPWRFR